MKKESLRNARRNRTIQKRERKKKHQKALSAAHFAGHIYTWSPPRCTPRWTPLSPNVTACPARRLEWVEKPTNGNPATPRSRSFGLGVVITEARAMLFWEIYPGILLSCGCNAANLTMFGVVLRWTLAVEARCFRRAVRRASDNGIRAVWTLHNSRSCSEISFLKIARVGALPNTPSSVCRVCNRALSSQCILFPRLVASRRLQAPEVFPRQVRTDSSFVSQMRIRHLSLLLLWSQFGLG